jgi:hypothetical protein
MAQLDDASLSAPGPGGGSSIAVMVWHISGNLASRFTDFLTSDGEKTWRHRDEEFEHRAVPRAEIREKWERGWNVLLGTLAGLTDEDLTRNVAIRGVPLRVDEALHRSLAHVAYHVGQIVYLAKGMLGGAWSSLSIPPGKSAEYNRDPGLEKPKGHGR